MVSVLRDWPHQRLWDLARLLRPRRAVRGTYLIKQGSPLRDQPVCFLRAGHCRVERTIGLPRAFPPGSAEASATIPLALLFPGDVFGEQARGPTAALPRTATRPSHSEAGGVATRGDTWRAQGLLHRATVDGDEGETLRAGKTNAAVIAESAVQASRRTRCTRGVYTWHAPLECPPHLRCSSCPSRTSSCSAPSRDRWRCSDISTRRDTCQKRSSQRDTCRRRSREHCHV